MVQKRESKIGVTADARKAPPQGTAQGREIRRAHVGQVPGLHVAPDLLHGIQVRRVGGQALDREPRALAAQVREHPAALVPAEAIPDEDDPPAAEMPLEHAQKGDEAGVGVTAGVGLKEEATAAAVPAKGQGARDGEPVPMAPGVGQDGRLATGGPGAPDDRLLGDATFVLEDEPGVLPRGVFFRAGQRRRFHTAIAASSRSRARRAGRWSDQPNARSTRQTWPG